jgi:hypothetical protein
MLFIIIKEKKGNSIEKFPLKINGNWFDFWEIREVNQRGLFYHI